jgi:hypothetical protein
MPEYLAPWQPSASTTDPTRSNPTRRGDIECAAGNWTAWDYNWAELRHDVPAEPDASACNVRIEEPFNVTAHATAFAWLGYESAAVELSIFAREGAIRRELRRQVVHATSVIINPDTPTWPDRPLEFAEPLLFERPATGPGTLQIGMRADCFAGGAGFVLAGSGCRIATFLPRMTVEWLWN